MNIEEATDIDLLRELVRRNGIGPAADTTSRNGQWDSILIGIGNDDTAEITLPRESSSVLMEMDLGDRDYQKWVQLDGGVHAL